MSLRRFQRRLLGVLLCVLAATVPCFASAATTATKAAAAAAPALTQAQAQQLLNVLTDPKQRAAFITTLQNVSRALPLAVPAASAVPVPLAPDSLGAEVIRQSAGWVNQLSRQLGSLGHAVGHLPQLWRWMLHVFTNPQSRAMVFDAVWKLALVTAGAAAVELGIRRLLRRPIAGIVASAPNGAGSELETETEASGEIPDALPPEEPVLRHRRLTRTLRAMRRLPWVALRFILELMPIGAFAAVGYLGAEFAGEPSSRLVLLAGVDAYLICRIIIAITRMFVAPSTPQLRLIHMSDQTAAYILIWVRRLVAVAVFGTTLAQVGMLFGLEASARDAMIKVVALLDHLFLVIIVLQIRAPVAAAIAARPGKRGAFAMLRNRVASVWHLIAIFYIMALWLVWAAEVRDGYVRVWHLFAVTCGVLILARLVSIVALGALDRGFRIPPDLAHRYPGLEARANHYYPLLRGLVSGLLLLFTCLALLEAWGVDTFRWFTRNPLGSHIVSALLTTAIAALITVALWETANAAIEQHLARLSRDMQVVRLARLRTLQPILRTALLLTLLTIFGLTVLSEIGVNIAPLLAGAGIVGVAIGFGSQKLVQDFITGIFLLLENAMQVGDAVTVAGLSGAVENLSIRTIRLRAGDGSVHIIPFSSVSTVTNANRGVGNAAVSVSVPVEEDTDHVCEVLCGIARDMRNESPYSDMMRSDLQLWGVDKLDAATVTIVGQIVCTDSGRWGVQREFNRRTKIRFQERGIRFATPVQTILMRTDSEPAGTRLAASDTAPSPATMAESPPPSALGHTD